MVVLGCKIYKLDATGRCLPHQATCLFLFALLINYSFSLAHHLIHRQCDPHTLQLFSWQAFSNQKHGSLTAIYSTNFFLSVPSSFVGKIYIHHRSEQRIESWGINISSSLERSVSAIWPLFSILCPFRSLDLIFSHGLCRITWSVWLWKRQTPQKGKECIKSKR